MILVVGIEKQYRRDLLQLVYETFLTVGEDNHIRLQRGQLLNAGLIALTHITDTIRYRRTHYPSVVAIDIRDAYRLDTQTDHILGHRPADRDYPLGHGVELVFAATISHSDGQCRAAKQYRQPAQPSQKKCTNSHQLPL